MVKTAKNAISLVLVRTCFWVSDCTHSTGFVGCAKFHSSNFINPSLMRCICVRIFSSLLCRSSIFPGMRLLFFCWQAILLVPGLVSDWWMLCRKDYWNNGHCFHSLHAVWLFLLNVHKKLLVYGVLNVSV